MVEDLDSLADEAKETNWKVVVGDAQKAKAWTRLTTKASGSASSPPYLNNFDYADATRLEMYFLGEADSWKSLCEVARTDMIVATTQQTSMARAEAAWVDLDSNGAVKKRLVDIAKLLTVERRSRGRGKEYDRVVPTYFAGLDVVIQQMAKNLEAGARSAWLVGDSAPYGVYVDTPDLLSALATGHGFEVEADVTIRKRGLRWVGAGARHSLPLAERLIVWKRA